MSSFEPASDRVLVIVGVGLLGGSIAAAAKERGIARRVIGIGRNPQRLQAAVDAGKFAIGVDSNQNYLHPGTMLTSMIKRVDVAIYNAFKDAKDGKWTSGLQVLGLAEDGVGWAIDEHNRSLISADMESKIEKARMDIIAGKVVVKGYKSN